MEKVKITRKQADLLHDLLSQNNVKWIFSHLADWKNVDKSTPEMAELHYWYIENPYFVSKAMIVGYEVEETPEDKVKSYFKNIANSHSDDQYVVGYNLGSRNAVIEILNLLNIKIEGIN